VNRNIFAKGAGHTLQSASSVIYPPGTRDTSRHQAARDAEGSRCGERKLRMGKLVDQMAFYGSSLILPKLAITRETSFPALTAL
jgi:hypothetical protein